jgi:hypothetical protein
MVFLQLVSSIPLQWGKWIGWNTGLHPDHSANHLVSWIFQGFPPVRSGKWLDQCGQYRFGFVVKQAFIRSICSGWINGSSPEVDQDIVITSVVLAASRQRSFHFGAGLKS